MLSFLNRKQPEKLFLSLVISEGTVAASLWKASSSGQSVLEHADPIEWNMEAPQSLIDASDVALEHLSPQVNTVKEVLLGLPESWAVGQSIASDKKKLLADLSKQLNLKSVGFVIIPEAIAALFRDREKTGLNALLVFVTQKTVQLLPLVHGQAETGAKVGRSDSLVKDIVEASARGDYKSLPGRMLLASQDLSEAEMTSAQQELGAAEWKEHLFLQRPRVDLVPPQMILDAVSLAGGKEVALALGILKGGKTDEAQEDKPEEPSKNQEFGFKPVGEGGQDDEEDGTDEEQDEKEGDAEDEESDGKVEMGILEPPPARRIPKVILIIGAILIGLLLVTAVSAFAIMAAAKANIAVIIKSQPVTLDTTLTIDANASETNAEANILKATQRTKDVTDTSEALTTGSKTIGDKAKGEVTIFNLTPAGEKSFKAGTVLKLDDKVQFTTDADVTVPARGDANSNYAPGSVKVNVTAATFGAESNIAGNTELTIGGYDKASFVAKANAAFTGGTSRNVQVVSELDQKKLSDALFADLKQKALAAFNSEVSPNEHVSLSDKVEVTKKQFSDDIGKEVKSFTLTMTVTATAIVYTNEDISTFATAKLASQILPGAVLKADRTSIEIKDQKPVSDTKTLVNATISSVIIPAFEADQISRVLAGKSLDDARAFLDSQDAVYSYEITFSPALAGGLLQNLPSQDKIIVESRVE